MPEDQKPPEAEAKADAPKTLYAARDCHVRGREFKCGDKIPDELLEFESLDGLLAAGVLSPRKPAGRGASARETAETGKGRETRGK